MKLPFRKSAFVPRVKLVNYLLSEAHSVGRFKARIFRSLGFEAENADYFEEALINIAQSEEIQKEIDTVFGKKYIIDGDLETPTGKRIKVRTIWILERSQKRPRFVTVYPL